MSTSPTLPPDPRPPVADALEKSQEVQGKVKRAADELAVVHAVLDKEIPEEERTGEVDQAVKHTGRLEKKLQKTADLLDEVTKTLESEVERAEPKATK